MRTKLLLLTICLAGAPVVSLLPGCSSSPSANSGADSAASTASARNDSGKSGNQLWADNCIRCHNNPSPSRYSDSEWQVVMRHMRIRANLTAEEEHKILAFLQSAN
jgi:hypothetical protein